VSTSSSRDGRTPFRSLNHQTRVDVRTRLVRNERGGALSGWLAVD
jgi:hypothetical protein